MIEVSTFQRVARFAAALTLALVLACEGGGSGTASGTGDGGARDASDSGSSAAEAGASTAACKASGGTCQQEAPCFGTWADSSCSGESAGFGCCIPPATPTPCQQAGGTCEHAEGITGATSCGAGAVVSALSCETPGGESGVFHWWCCAPDVDAGDAGDSCASDGGCSDSSSP